VYLTTLSEPLSKVVSYVQRHTFFDVDKVGTQILYEELGPELSEAGPAALVPRVLEVIRTRSPAIIVIDSFKSVHDLAESPQQMRRIISELAEVLSAYSVTAFLLGEYSHGDIEAYPEFAIADGIVQLERSSLGARDERFFRVFKLRGSGYNEGQHAFRITPSGLEIYPRLVTPDFESYTPVLERVPSGIPGLDAVIGGGIWVGATTLIVGPTGAGKTTMALQFAMEGIRRGEPTLYVNFQENPAQMWRLIRNLGVDPEDAVARGFRHIYASPVELQIDRVIVEIFNHIQATGVRRVVIDAVGDLATAASDPQRLHDYLYSLIQHFVVHNITTVLTFETPMGITGMSADEQRFSYMSDNVLMLTLPGEERYTGTLRVIKTRNSAHDPRTHEFQTDASGAHVR
jgi:circadian clock protein KaiC